jgi:hypothetical protein
MRTSDVLLHGAKALFLEAMISYMEAFNLDDLNRINSRGDLVPMPWHSSPHLDGDKVGLVNERLLGGGGVNTAKARKTKTRKDSETYSCTSLATTGTVVIFQGTNDFVVGVGDRERARQRASRRHGAYVPSLLLCLSPCRTRICLSVLLVCGRGEDAGGGVS